VLITGNSQQDVSGAGEEGSGNWGAGAKEAS
jgi:hypothetical protein